MKLEYLLCTLSVYVAKNQITYIGFLEVNICEMDK